MSHLVQGRFGALVLKELRQIRRDRRLVVSLILAPAMQVLLFGFALDAEVRDMPLASWTGAAPRRAASSSPS